MSEEIKIEKINMPLFNINEEAELQNKLSFHLDEFTNEIIRTMSKDTDIIILKKVIEKQQAEIKRQQQEIEELKDKNKTLETLLQGNLYEMYLYYKELASRYQANSVSKDEIIEKIKEYQHKLCQDIEEEKVVEYEDIIQVLKELLGE